MKAPRIPVLCLFALACRASPPEPRPIERDQRCGAPGAELAPRERDAPDPQVPVEADAAREAAAGR